MLVPARRGLGPLLKGGWLTLQIPDEHDSDSHVLMRRLADSRQCQGKLRDAKYHVNHVAEPKRYAEVLIDGGLATDVWTATYLHDANVNAPAVGIECL